MVLWNTETNGQLGKCQHNGCMKLILALHPSNVLVGKLTPVTLSVQIFERMTTWTSITLDGKWKSGV